MVNRGRSGACVTCKQRRVKCDEGKPTCKTCKRLKLECGGYKQKKQLRFKDQTHKFCTPDATADGKVIVFQAEKHVTGANDGKTPSVASSSPALSVESFDDLILTNNDSADPLCYDLDVLEEIAIPNVPRSLPVTDTAVPFFLSYYASMGRDRRSARGFFEVFVPVYRTQLQVSPLSLAVLALSTGILSLWRQDRFDTSPKLYTRALACLRQSLSDASERNKPATLLAILTLQLYENVAAVYGLRSALPVHHNGAISLLPPAESGNADNMIQEHTQRYMLHIESSSALRQKRPIRQEASSWIESKALSKTTNPSTTLDAIGATVAGFQAFHLDLAGSATYEPLSSERLDQSVAEANDIEARLTNWAENMPMHMQPLRLDNVDSLIPTYQATCDVFQSCQTANLWNLWHCQRLILAKVLIGFVERILGKQLMELDEVRLTLLLDMSAKYTSILRDSLDSVCYSVPFYLGNRTRPISLLDFSDPLILLPSCDLGGVPDYEHRQHIIARGAWHVMSPLSHVLTLFSDADGLSVAKLLRPDQLEWVREQFVRSLIVIRLTPPGSGDWERQAHLLSAGHGVAHADYLAKEVRKGAMIMSGL